MLMRCQILLHGQWAQSWALPWDNWPAGEGSPDPVQCSEPGLKMSWTSFIFVPKVLFLITGWSICPCVDRHPISNHVWRSGPRNWPESIARISHKSESHNWLCLLCTWCGAVTQDWLLKVYFSPHFSTDFIKWERERFFRLLSTI